MDASRFTKLAIVALVLAALAVSVVAVSRPAPVQQGSGRSPEQNTSSRDADLDSPHEPGWSDAGELSPWPQLTDPNATTGAGQAHENTASSNRGNGAAGEPAANDAARDQVSGARWAGVESRFTRSTLAPTSDMTRLMAQAREVIRRLYQTGEFVDPPTDEAYTLDYVGMALVDVAIDILSTEDSELADLRAALHWLLTLPGDRGAEWVLRYVNKPGVEHLAWAYFEKKRVARLAADIARALPDLDALAEGQVDSLRNRDRLIAAVARNPSMAAFMWLIRLGNVEIERCYRTSAGLNPAYVPTIETLLPSEISRALAGIAGATPALLQSTPPRLADMMARFIADPAAFTSEEIAFAFGGLAWDSRGELRTPVPDHDASIELDEIHGQLLESRAKLRTADRDRLYALGNVAVRPCLRSIDALPLADGPRGRVDFRFVIDLDDPALAPYLEELGLALLAKPSDYSGFHAALNLYFQRQGSAGHRRGAEIRAPGYLYAKRQLELVALGQHQQYGLTASENAYDTARAIDDPGIVPWLLAARESAPTWATGSFGPAMTSLTRHIFTPLEENDDPARWRQWLEAHAIVGGGE